MLSFRHLFYLGCLAIAALLPPFVQAQAPPETETSKTNSSPGGLAGTEDPKAVAWQAYDAMRIGDESAIPNLLSLASRWQPLVRKRRPDGSIVGELPSREEEERDAMTVVLDALIQLNARVPAATLRNLAPDFGNAVAVILARMPAQESGPLAQEFFRSAKSGDTVQYVSAALLALHPPPGFAGRLLAGITVRAGVIAVPPINVAIGAGFGGAACIELPEPGPEDWPEMGQYKLSVKMSEGASVLVEGNDPIYVTREESTRYLGNDCEWRGLYLAPQARQALVAEMLGIPAEQIPWDTDVTAPLEFVSLEEFSAEVLGFIEEQQLMYLNTAKALEARGFLTASEVSQSLPLMEVCLEDERRMRPADEDSGDRHPHSDVQVDLEPISKDAIELPARVVWAPYTCF